MRHKSDAAEMFKQSLADTRADGVASQVATVRSDRGGEFCGGEFGDQCRSRCISNNSLRRAAPNSMGKPSAR